MPDDMSDAAESWPRRDGTFSSRLWTVDGGEILSWVIAEYGNLYAVVRYGARVQLVVSHDIVLDLALWMQ